MPKVPTKARRKTLGNKRPASRMELPEHFQVTAPELAVLTRLIRVMRQKDNRGAYWLGPFIEWLLYLDITEPNLDYLIPKLVLKSLQDMGDSGGLLAGGSTFIKKAAIQCPGISFVSGTSPAPAGKWNTVMLPHSEEDQFYQLLRLWRMDHPEPPKRPVFPKGRTQHESDPDSD